MPRGIYLLEKRGGLFKKGHRINNGRTAWNKGKEFSKESKEKMRVAHLGEKMSKERKEKMSISHRGEKSYLWKGGRTELEQKIRTCFKYRQWRSDVFTKDDFTCQECGERGCYLEAHHIKEYSKILDEYNIKTLDDALVCEELWDINNGKTLCKKCHNKTKKWKTKKN